MEFSKIVDRQIAADKRRGFHVEFDNDVDRISQIEKDLIGLVGEVGEFSNIIKKVRLTISHSSYQGPSLAESEFHLREELADAMIYLIRLSIVLNGNLENDVLNKMNINDRRYGPLENE